MPSAANDLILSIDQGTTSSRAILYNPAGRILASAQQEFRQIFPRSGWVEHDGEEIWQSVLETCRAAIGKIDRKTHNIIGIGITNQRETSLIWDRESGQPIYNAIVWQDRRTAEFCARMKREGLEAQVQERTGLLLDPYFSASKIAWILDNVDGARERAAAGALAFGTVDSWLIWRLTGGKRHVCDATNACRTLLWNIHTQSWDDALCRYFNVPPALLPEVLDCADEFGDTDAELFGKPIPIRGVAGDQHAAVIGQGCFQPNMIKATYGTGCFVMVNTGLEPIRSKNRLLTTLAYRLGGTCHYALEGSIFVAGAAVQWLRDGLKIIGSAAESNALAEAANPHSHLYFVPAFVGLGAPHWDPEARGAIFGLTRDSGPAEIARATLESVGYQSRELLDAIALDYPGSSAKRQLRVDGGMAASDWTMQFLADCLDIEVERTKNLESTALGAAWLAGHHLSSWPDQEEFAASWQAEQRFQPRLDEKKREELWKGWQNAVMRTKSR